MSDDELAAAFGIDLSDPATRSVVDLTMLNTESDFEMIRALVLARRESEMTQEGVAIAWGIPLAEVVAFESYDNDPKLSMVRRYAQMLGIRVEHSLSAAAPESVPSLKEATG
jgi:DNA-binding XRE family transcriptional regulator